MNEKLIYTERELPQQEVQYNKSLGFHPNNKSRWTSDNPPKRLKLCIECKEYKLETEFNKNRSKWDGLVEYCKPCHRYRNRWTEKRKLQDKKHFEKVKTIVNERKLIGCNYCGDKRLVVLEFNHKDRKLKLYEIATITSSTRVSIKTLEKELDKCEVVCRNCHRRVTQLQRTNNNLSRPHRQRLKEFINSYKTDPCKDCGNEFPYYVMDFDHINSSTKLFNISQSISKDYSQDLVLAEMNKCELVCANCHKIRTINRLNG